MIRSSSIDHMLPIGSVSACLSECEYYHRCHDACESHQRMQYIKQFFPSEEALYFLH